MAFQFRRDTHAAPLARPPSSSDASKSLYFERFGLTNYKLYNGPPSKYNLQRLIGLGVQDYKAAEDELAKWVAKEIGEPRERVVSGQMLRLKPNLDPQGISVDKRPDVMIMSDNDEPTTLVQIKVDSGKSWTNTIRKLVHGLIHQLTSLRNWDDTIMSVSGFYFPFEKQECVVKVDVTWNDMELKFGVERSNVEDPSKVGDKICSVWRDAKETNLGCHGDHNNYYIPLSRDIIQREFGQDVFQISSRQSVLLVDTTKERVYKYPFSGDVYRVLVWLMDDVANRKITLSRSEIPKGKKEAGLIRYFEFNLLKYPWDRREAKTRVKDSPQFLTSVIEAVQELHDKKIAHLDIRLPNICRDESDNAVLIDLDRMQYIGRVNSPGSYESVMYKKPDGEDWTADHFDWRQVGIMMVHILSDEVYDYHKWIPSYDHPFLKKLIEEGKK